MWQPPAWGATRGSPPPIAGSPRPSSQLDTIEL